MNNNPIKRRIFPLETKNKVSDKSEIDKSQSDPFKKEKSFEDTLNEILTAVLQPQSVNGQGPVDLGTTGETKSADVVTPSNLSSLPIPPGFASPAVIPTVEIDSDSAKTGKQSPHQWGVQG